MNYTKEQIIEELGIGNAEPEKQEAMLDAIYSTLNMRIGMELSDKLTDEQLDQFNSLTEENDEAAANWLIENVEGYEDLVSNELKNVIDEIKQRVDKITQSLN